MATVSKWTPFGVALDVTATGSTVTRTSATQYTVKINVSWETYYSGAQTNYGMTATSGGVTHTISKFDGTKRSSGSGSFTGTYSISGNGSATKTVTVTFKNFNTDNGDSASKNVSFSVSVPAWTSYKITFNANGGSGAPGSQTKWKDQTLTLSSTKPTRTGYSFMGWGMSANGSVVYASGASYTSNASVTLYAVWKANTYTVKYDANGGSYPPANQTKIYGQTLTLSKVTPTRTNYTFKGWGTSASATTVTYAAGGSYTANAAVTLYAVWELAYTKPRISNLTVIRVNSSNVEADDGTNARVTFNWARDKTAGAVQISYKPTTASESSYSTYTLSPSGTSGTVSEMVGNNRLSAESSYDIRIRVADNGGESYATSILPSMKFVLDFLAGGNGAAAGKVAELEGVFDIGFKTRLFGGLLYPVIEPNTDLNSLLTPNVYAGENTNSANYGNCPITSGTFIFEVMSAGPNGQLLQRLTVCDKTKPAVYERFYYTSAWGDWYGGWIYPTLGSDFVMYATDEAVNKPRYRKDGRVVEVRGIVKPAVNLPKSGDGSTTSYAIFTLPAGYRPNSPIYSICQGSGNCTWMLQVNSNGNVTFSRYRNGNANATADTGTWLPFQATFIAN